jgi:2-dehydropantoate 2-reductase
VKIAVVGPGAMGCFFGARFGRAGHEVLLIDHRPERARLLTLQGILLQEGDAVSRVPVHATAEPAEAGPADLVLFLVKAGRSEEAAARLAPLLGPSTPVLTLQNGFGGADILAAAVGPERVLIGVTAQGATLVADGEARHGGSGDTLIGSFRKGEARRPEALAPFADAGLPAAWVDDVMPAVWKKLAANCGINAVTALCNLLNGRIPEIEPAAALCRDAVIEAVRVARAAGVELGGEEEMARWVLGVARATAVNRSSMGQDIDRRRPTEVAFLNGAVVREGKRLSVPTPVNLTLTRLVLTLEAGYAGSNR